LGALGGSCQGGLLNQRRPHAEEKLIRFGCGAFMGLLLGLLVVFALLAPGAWMTAAVLLFSAICCGWLALRYGDPFWYKLAKYIPWLLYS
jgi:uncharacterized membrane protein YccC